MLSRFWKFVWEEQAVESSVGDISLRDLVTNLKCRRIGRTCKDSDQVNGTSYDVHYPFTG
jgi:hypothetical protein